MLAASMIQMFDFSEPHLTKRLAFDDGDWVVGDHVGSPGEVQIVDLDGQIKAIVHPGNASDVGKLAICAIRLRLDLTPHRSTGYDGRKYSCV